MLLSGALMRPLELCDQGLLELPAPLLQDQIPVVLTQLVNRTLLTQHNTATWDANESPEATAYGILTLAAVFTLAWIATLKEEIEFAMQKGQAFLVQAQGAWDKPQYLWIEKVTYGSRRLSEAYCLAAMRPSISSHSWSEQISDLVGVYIVLEHIKLSAKPLAMIGYDLSPRILSRNLISYTNFLPIFIFLYRLPTYLY